MKQRRREPGSARTAASSASASRPSGASAVTTTTTDADPDSAFVVQLSSLKELDTTSYCAIARAILVQAREILDTRLQRFLSQPAVEMLKQSELAEENLSSKVDPSTQLRRFGDQEKALEACQDNMREEAQGIWAVTPLTPPLHELFVQILRVPDLVF